MEHINIRTMFADSQCHPAFDLPITIPPGKIHKDAPDMELRYRHSTGVVKMPLRCSFRIFPNRRLIREDYDVAAEYSLPRLLRRDSYDVAAK